MAHHKSAIRQERRSLRRKTVNQKNKSTLRSQIKKVRTAIKSNKKDEAQLLLPPVFSLIDQTVKKGTVHKNKGARYKARLSKQVSSLKTSDAK